MEKYLINPNHKVSKINKDIYGHFSEHLGRCIYEGIFVGKDSKIPNVNGMRIDVVNALKDMGIPVLRWPGGCFADEYHWKDGIGDLSNRKKWLILIGAVLLKIIHSVRTNILNFAASLVVILTLTVMWVPAQLKK